MFSCFILMKNKGKSATMVDGKCCVKTNDTHKYRRKSCLSDLKLLPFLLIESGRGVWRKKLG